MAEISKVRVPIIPADLRVRTLRKLSNNEHLESLRVKDCVLGSNDARAMAIDGVVFENDEISSCKLRKSSLADVVFTNCLLFGTDFDGSGWLRVELTGGTFSGLALSACSLQDVKFSRAKLNLANFRMSTLKRVSFVDCELSEADFQGADLTDIEFKNCDLDQAEFSGSKMNRVDMRSSNISSLKGVSSLNGVTITTAQMIGIAHLMASELGLLVRD